MVISRLIFFKQIEMMVVRTIKPPNITNCTAPSLGDWGADAGCWGKNPGEPNWWVGTGAAAHQGQLVWWMVTSHKCGDTDYDVCSELRAGQRLCSHLTWARLTSESEPNPFLKLAGRRPGLFLVSGNCCCGQWFSVSRFPGASHPSSLGWVTAQSVGQ